MHRVYTVFRDNYSSTCVVLYDYYYKTGCVSAQSPNMRKVLYDNYLTSLCSDGNLRDSHIYQKKFEVRVLIESNLMSSGSYSIKLKIVYDINKFNSKKCFNRFENY